MRYLLGLLLMFVSMSSFSAVKAHPYFVKLVPIDDNGKIPFFVSGLKYTEDLKQIFPKYNYKGIDISPVLMGQIADEVQRVIIEANEELSNAQIQGKSVSIEYENLAVDYASINTSKIEEVVADLNDRNQLLEKVNSLNLVINGFQYCLDLKSKTRVRSQRDMERCPFSNYRKKFFYKISKTHLRHLDPRIAQSFYISTQAIISGPKSSLDKNISQLYIFLGRYSLLATKKSCYAGKFVCINNDISLKEFKEKATNLRNEFNTKLEKAKVVQGQIIGVFNSAGYTFNLNEFKIVPDGWKTNLALSRTSSEKYSIQLSEELSKQLVLALKLKSGSTVLKTGGKIQNINIHNNSDGRLEEGAGLSLGFSESQKGSNSLAN